MKFENTEVFNFEGAIRGLRNPMDSWSKSDSHYGSPDFRNYYLGENDLNLAQRMIKGGDTHGKFMRQIMVSVDITAPRYFWSEFDTYKVGTVANSCSTMHKLTSYPITGDMFEPMSIYELCEGDIELECDIDDWYDKTIKILERLRLRERESKQFNYKYLMKNMLPEGFLQKRTVTLNYAVIRHMVASRTHHKLPQWHSDFINWAKTLPYARELLFYELKYE